MAWFQYILSHTTPEAIKALDTIPGVALRDRSVSAHDNCGFLVERILQAQGIRFSARLMKADFDPIDSMARLVKHGLREWVPDFLVDYQKAGILDLAHKSGFFLWAAGSGKTLGAICWSLAYPGRTIVTTRAPVRRQFAREITRFTEHEAYVIEEASDAAGLLESDALFCVVGYEALPNVLAEIQRWRPVNWIIDESHRLKQNRRWGATPTESGKLRFDPLENIAYAAMKLSRLTKRRLGCTATPIQDRTRDLWAQLDLVHPDAWGPFYKDDRASFTRRYCAAHKGTFGGIDTKGSSNLDELWDRVSIVSNHVAHSVTHRDLPPRRRIVTFVGKKEQNATAGGFKSVMKKAALAGRGALLEARLMEAASKKRAHVIELLEDCVAGEQKVVVFTGRREDCDKLGEAVRSKFGKLASVFVGHGGIPATERDGITTGYMAARGPAILVGTGDAFGEGVNLQDSDLLLVVMLPYTPGRVVQWEGRVARLGQKRPVLIQYLVAEGTVDEHVAQVLLEKLPAVERVSKDDSIDGLADQLAGMEDEEAILESIFTKLGGAQEAA